MDKNLPIAFDTETANNIPFIGTATDSQLKSILCNIKDVQIDYNSFKELCEDITITKVFHSAVYDIYCLSKIDINVAGKIEDTLIMATLINENFEAKKLKSLATQYLAVEDNENKELKKVKLKLKREADKQGIEFTYAMIPRTILEPYAIKDTEYTIRLFYFFSRDIEKYRDLYNKELELIPIVVEMIKNGFRIDRAFVADIIKEYSEKQIEVYTALSNFFKKHDIFFTDSIIRKTEKGIFSAAIRENITNITENDILFDDELGYTLIYEVDFNPSASCSHTRQVLNKLKAPITEFTKDGEFVTDAKTLKKIKEDNIDCYEFISLLLKWRFLEKQLGTYYKPLLNKYTSEVDDIAHFIFYPSGAKSGRFTAELIQTIPRKVEAKTDEDRTSQRLIRRAFIPRENSYFLAIDYSQIEMRIFADVSGCKLLVNDINNGYDPHLGTAINIFGESIVLASEEAKKKHRQFAKTINFGLIYGMGVNLLAETLGLPYREALDVLQAYHSKYPVKEFIQETTSKLYRTGLITITYNSSRMNFTRDYRVPTQLAYKGCNMIVQGTAAYCMKFGLSRVYNWIKHNCPEVKIIGTIHDEIIFDVPKSIYSLDLVKNFIDCLEDKETFKVPILADAKISDKSWADCKEIKLCV